ncbi:unnamed protein product [Phytophthora lilii]|uniref:Sugar transporter SWEET1 n=1 Tax=Phytophthora lilii TaxID=2077276 RepID=A0A9W6UB03_9STRA|nr:unnamed protein product [Phytophthora lilii]
MSLFSTDIDDCFTHLLHAYCGGIRARSVSRLLAYLQDALNRLCVCTAGRLDLLQLLRLGHVRASGEQYSSAVRDGCGRDARVDCFWKNYYHWTQDYARIHKFNGVAFCILAAYTFYYSIGTSGVTLINLALYVSPLETIKEVIRKKDASTIPITISATFLANGAIWVVFSLKQDDMLVLVPNAIGLVFCIAQVVLYMIYRPRRSVSNTTTYEYTTSTVCASATDVSYASFKDDSRVACA